MNSFGILQSPPSVQRASNVRKEISFLTPAQLLTLAIDSNEHSEVFENVVAEILLLESSLSLRLQLSYHTVAILWALDIVGDQNVRP